MKKKELFLIVVLFFTFACSQKQESSKIQLNLNELYKNKVSGFSEMPKNVFVQVTSPDYSEEVYFLIDCLSQASCSTVNLQVPPGRDSLVQLAILTESNGQAKQLFYGDKKQTLNAGANASVSIHLQVLSDFSTEAKWSGRLKNSAGVFPTGLVHPKMHIENKPSMWIPNLNFLMLNGWFQTQLFNNFKVSYWLNKNQKLFTNITSLSDSISITQLSERATLHANTGTGADFRMSVPSHYTYNISTAATESESEYEIFVGYYGFSSVSSFCVDDNSTFLLQDNSQKWCSDAVCASPLNSEISNAGDVVTSIPVNALSVCTSGLYSTVHPILRKSHLMNSKDLMGIRPPLKASLVSGTYTFVNATETATNVYTISGDFLPDTSSLFTQVEVYGLNTSSTLETEDYCKYKKSSEFTKIGNLPITTSTNSFSGSLTFDSTLYYDHFLCFENSLNTTLSQYFPLRLNTNPAALLTISESNPFDFGSVTLGNIIQHTFTVTNSGGAVATAMSGSGLVTPFDFLGGSYPGIGGTCGTTLANGLSCTLAITFGPASAVSSSDSIILSYHDGVAAQTSTRDIQGTGSTPAQLTISESEPYDYGTHVISTVNNHNFTITNTGGSTATSMTGSGLATPFQFSGGSYPGTGDCGVSLGAGNSCTISVSFIPGSLGLIADQIDINYNDGLGGQVASRGIQGTGANPAVLIFAEAPLYDYGTIGVGTPTSYTFNITNSGGSTATSLVDTGIATPFIFSGGSFPGTGGTCSTTLASGNSCTIVITFTPPATTLYTDTINLTYNDGAILQNATVNIQGTGL